MGFFRKLFRNRPDQESDAPSEVSAGEAAPATAAPPEVDEPPVSIPQSDTANPAAPTDEVPWWEASTPASDEEQALVVNAQAPVAVVASPDELQDTARLEVDLLDDAPGMASEQEIASADAPLQPDMVVTQPITVVARQPFTRDSTRELGESDAPSATLHPSHQGLAAAALRDIGRVRQINQDSVFSLLTVLPREGGDIPMGLFVVADGMGGHEGGEVASRLAVSSVVRHVLSQILLPALEDGTVDALQSVMTEAIEEANRVIWDEAQAVGSDMGTTCTAVLLLGSALYIGHVGDSRAYILEPDGMQLLTNDHSAVGRLIQLGQLAPSEAREHPLRSQLYRTVGQHPEIQVDFIYHPIGTGSHLLMGSDGLWGLLQEEQMANVIRSYTWPQDVCRTLVAEANLAGGDDNISVVVVSFHVAERTTA